MRVKRNRFEVYSADDGWRWRLVAEENGEILASGQEYSRQIDCISIVNRIAHPTLQTVLVVEGDVEHTAVAVPSQDNPSGLCPSCNAAPEAEHIGTCQFGEPSV